MGTLTAPAALLDAARRAAQVLSASAVRRDELATWVTACGPDVHAGGVPTLYDGDAGIGLACAVLAGPLDDAALAELGIAAVRNAVRRADTISAAGLHDGRAGIGIAALHVAALLDEPGLRADGLALLRACTESASPGPAPSAPAHPGPAPAHSGSAPAHSGSAPDDLASGAAGVLLALRLGSELDGADDLLERANAIAAELVAHARRGPVGCSWPAPGERRGTCGLAHGNSGIALALGSCGAVDAVRDALRWERAWFDQQRPGWPDPRSPDAPVWCRGAAGIGVVRLALHALGVLPPGEQPGLLAEAGAALQAARAWLASPSADGYGLTLCHGAGGAIELLILAHELLGDELHLATARRHAAALLDTLGDDPDRWPSGYPAGGWSAGLLSGLAGTAWTLARLALPAAVPSPAIMYGGAPWTRRPGPAP